MDFLPLAVLSSWQRTLLQWLGCDFADAPANAKAELLWTNLPASWGVFVLLAVVAAHASAAVPFGALSTNSPVAGLRISLSAPPVASTEWPLINMRDIVLGFLLLFDLS